MVIVEALTDIREKTWDFNEYVDPDLGGLRLILGLRESIPRIRYETLKVKARIYSGDDLLAEAEIPPAGVRYVHIDQIYLLSLDTSEIRKNYRIELEAAASGVNASSTYEYSTTEV